VAAGRWASAAVLRHPDPGRAPAGCIGFRAAQRPLLETVREAARAAAFHDPRFPPLRPPELPEVRLEISVLSRPRPVSDLGEIQVGRHGLIVRRGPRSGLLLPQVAEEYGWDRETFLSHTCAKAGLPEDSWREAGTEMRSRACSARPDRRCRPGDNRA
jgi:AmmeMemoRadiSam system protein A